MGLAKVEGSVVKTLVVARHGNYLSSGHLSPLGVEAVNNLSNQLQKYLDHAILIPGDAIITYSLADRAKESAKLMSSMLRLAAIPMSSLGDIDGKDYYGQEKMILAEFENIARSYPCIISITHEPITAYLPVLLHPDFHNDQGRIINTAWARVYETGGQVTTISPDQIFRSKK